MAHTEVSHPIPLSQPRALRWHGLRKLFGLAHQRRRLAQLDPYLLRDIGVDVDAARAEAKRPFWDVPANWRS